MLENPLETQNQDLESLLCKTYFFIPDSRKSGTWKHVWETQAALLQWTRPNGINTVATSSSWSWGLPLFFILRACDKCIFTVPDKKWDWSAVSSSSFNVWLTKPTITISLPHAEQQVPVSLPSLMCQACWQHHKCLFPVASERKNLQLQLQNVASYIPITGVKHFQFWRPSDKSQYPK